MKKYKQLNHEERVTIKVCLWHCRQINKKNKNQKTGKEMCHPLPREGKKVSCAEHTVKDLFTYSPIHLFTLKHKLDCFACYVSQNKFSCSQNKATFASTIYAFGQDVVGFYTSDDMIYYLLPGYMSIIVFVDVNGKKGPNQMGRDLFSYGYCMGKNGKFGTGVTGENVCWEGDSGLVDRIMSNGWKMDY